MSRLPRVEGFAARRAALAVLDLVLRRGTTADSAEEWHAANLPAADAALTRAIVGEVLRHLADLDALIDSATRKPLPDDSKARMVLRIALAQRLLLDTPAHAVLATALPLVDGGPRRLVHGVLGTLFRRATVLPDPPRLPGPVADRWRSAWGRETVAAAERALPTKPPLDLSFVDQEAANQFVAATGALPLASRHARLAGPTRVTELPGFEQGRWWIQDLAASLPARLMPERPCRVLDLCAAPGGKTMQLAAAGHQVTALDRSESRLGRLRQNLDRTGLSAELVIADALQWSSDPFDAVLLDAPCSATGTFRRHPEVLYRARRSVISELAALQTRLIERAGRLVRPGGTLVYAVCSLEPDEGEAVIGEFLQREAQFQVAPPEPGELPSAIPFAGQFARVLPGALEAEGGADGFFVARLTRAA